MFRSELFSSFVILLHRYHYYHLHLRHEIFSRNRAQLKTAEIFI